MTNEEKEEKEVQEMYGNGARTQMDPATRMRETVAKGQEL